MIAQPLLHLLMLAVDRFPRRVCRSGRLGRARRSPPPTGLSVSWQPPPSVEAARAGRRSPAGNLRRARESMWRAVFRLAVVQCVPQPVEPTTFYKHSPGPKGRPVPPISLCCRTTRTRVHGQNAQKAKIARYADCEHNRDAVRADQ